MEAALRHGGERARPCISPDGGWVAYHSDETDGNQAIYIARFPGGGNKRAISTGIALQPMWSPDGNLLFRMRGGERGFMMVPIELGEDVRVGDTESLFEPGPAASRRFWLRNGIRQHDLSPDGQRFLMLKPPDAGLVDAAAPTSITVVRNWFDELQRLVPSP